MTVLPMPGRLMPALRRLAALLALVTIALPATAQPAATTQPLPPTVPAIGMMVEDVLLVAGKQVPLPQGSWLVAGVAQAGFDGATIGAYGRIANVILFRLVGNAVDAIAEVNTNLLPTMDGWGIAAACERTDLALSVVRYKAGWDGSCYFVTHTLLDAVPGGRHGALDAAMATARARGLSLPAVWLTAGFRVTNRNDVVDLRFHFSPATRGVADERPARWRDSAWAAARLEADPARLAVARGVTEWAVLFSGYVEAGIKGRLPAATRFASPGLPGAALPGGVLETRLAALEDLRTTGLLSASQYEAQVARLRERGLDPGSEVVDPATVALYKTLTYRPLVSLANLFIDLYWIGQPFAAGVLVLLQVTVNTTKFYFHELAWEQFVGGGTRRDSARVIDFDYIGRNG